MERSTSTYPWLRICRTAVAMILTFVFLGLLIVFTAFAIFTKSSELLTSVLHVVAYGVVFSCVWAGGVSMLRISGSSKNIFDPGGKD